MGEAQRKRRARRAQTAMMQQVVDSYFDMLSVPQRQGAPFGPADMLALLLEKAMLLGGFDEREKDRLINLLEEIERRMDDADFLVPDEREPDNWRQVGEVMPPAAQQAAKMPIDPERMALIEERARLIAAFVDSETKGLGWCVLLFELGDRPELTYVSNCNRDDMREALTEFLAVISAGQDFPPGTLTQRPN
jgi:hypothetical protein